MFPLHDVLLLIQLQKAPIKPSPSFTDIPLIYSQRRQSQQNLSFKSTVEPDELLLIAVR